MRSNCNATSGAPASSSCLQLELLAGKGRLPLNPQLRQIHMAHTHHINTTRQALLADFGLYWGHRVQHEFDALWRVHRVHHSIDTPTPYSTMYVRFSFVCAHGLMRRNASRSVLVSRFVCSSALQFLTAVLLYSTQNIHQTQHTQRRYIHRLDATLQGGIPMALAAVILRPAPAILYLSFAARVAENAFNHSGIDHWLVDLVCLKTLPFRVSASWHDAHHKFCNHPRNARNYAESWVIWDWVFGTVQPRSGRPQGAKAA